MEAIKINRVNLQSLWNTEFPQYIHQMVDISEKHNAEELHLRKSLDRLKAVLPNVDKIMAYERKNAFSNQLSEADVERDIYINAIIEQVKSFENISLPEIVVHYQVMDRLFDIHGRDIARTNRVSETERINDLLTTVENSTEVTAAVTALNLSNFFNLLKQANDRFGLLFKQQTEEKASAEPVDSKSIRSEASKRFTAYLTAIEFCSTEYEEADYKPLVNELNALADYYNTRLKARDTRRKNGKNVSNEPPIDFE